jgi:hypothetical protein
LHLQAKSFATQAHCLLLVDEVFALFEAWTHELLSYATRKHAPDLDDLYARLAISDHDISIGNYPIDFYLNLN